MALGAVQKESEVFSILLAILAHKSLAAVRPRGARTSHRLRRYPGALQIDG